MLFPVLHGHLPISFRYDFRSNTLSICWWLNYNHSRCVRYHCWSLTQLPSPPRHARLYFPTLLKSDITIWLALTRETWAEVVCVIYSWEHLTAGLVSPAFFPCHIIVKAHADNRASTSLVPRVTAMSRAFLPTCSKHEQEMSLSFQTSKMLGLFIIAA